MTNQEFMANISPEDWVKTMRWLTREYGKNFTDTDLAIIEWLKEEVPMGFGTVQSNEETQGERI